MLWFNRDTAFLYQPLLINTCDFSLLILYFGDQQNITQSLSSALARQSNTICIKVFGGTIALIKGDFYLADKIVNEKKQDGIKRQYLK